MQVGSLGIQFLHQLSGVLERVVLAQLELGLVHDAHIIDPGQLLQIAEQLLKLRVFHIPIEGYNGYTIGELIGIADSRVIHQHNIR